MFSAAELGIAAESHEKELDRFTDAVDFLTNKLNKLTKDSKGARLRRIFSAPPSITFLAHIKKDVDHVTIEDRRGNGVSLGTVDAQDALFEVMRKFGFDEPNLQLDDSIQIGLGTEALVKEVTNYPSSTISGLTFTRQCDRSQDGKIDSISWIARKDNHPQPKTRILPRI